MSINVTLKHLRAFTAVARLGSFTRASQSLAVSQPALTATVHQLEDQFGIKLFDRTTRKVTLTGEGEDFLPTAERLLGEFDTAIADVRAVAQRRRGRIGIAALPSVAVHLLPAIVSAFTERYPGVSVRLHDANASIVQEQVKRGLVDLGIGNRWAADPDLDFTQLLTDSFVLVCRKDHPLGQDTGPILWRDLEGHDFLGSAAATGIRPLLQGAPGLPENVESPKYEVSHIATLEGLLQAGLGISALPALAAPRSTHPPLVIRPLANPVIERHICLITRHGRSLSPAAQTMRRLIMERVPDRWPQEQPLN